MKKITQQSQVSPDVPRGFGRSSTARSRRHASRRSSGNDWAASGRLAQGDHGEGMGRAHDLWGKSQDFKPMDIPMYHKYPMNTPWILEYPMNSSMIIPLSREETYQKWWCATKMVHPQLNSLGVDDPGGDNIFIVWSCKKMLLMFFFLKVVYPKLWPINII